MCSNMPVNTFHESRLSSIKVFYCIKSIATGFLLFVFEDVMWAVTAWGWPRSSLGAWNHETISKAERHVFKNNPIQSSWDRVDALRISSQVASKLLARIIFNQGCLLVQGFSINMTAVKQTDLFSIFCGSSGYVAPTRCFASVPLLHKCRAIHLAVLSTLALFCFSSASIVGFTTTSVFLIQLSLMHRCDPFLSHSPPHHNVHRQTGKLSLLASDPGATEFTNLIEQKK